MQSGDGVSGVVKLAITTAAIAATIASASAQTVAPPRTATRAVTSLPATTLPGQSVPRIKHGPVERSRGVPLVGIVVGGIAMTVAIVVLASKGDSKG